MFAPRAKTTEDYRRLAAQSLERHHEMVMRESSRIREQIELCSSHLDLLEERDRNFVVSAKSRFTQYGSLSDGQKRWLGGLSSRLARQIDAEQEPDGRYVVSFEVSVTAESPQEAMEFALDDLRDESLGDQWNATVRSNKRSVNVSTAGSPPVVDVDRPRG